MSRERRLLASRSRTQLFQLGFAKPARQDCPGCKLCGGDGVVMVKRMVEVDVVEDCPKLRKRRKSQLRFLWKR